MSARLDERIASIRDMLVKIEGMLSERHGYNETDAAIDALHEAELDVRRAMWKLAPKK